MKSVPLLFLLLPLLASLGLSADKADVRDTATAKWVREEGSIDVMGSLTAIIAYGQNGERVPSRDFRCAG